MGEQRQLETTHLQLRRWTMMNLLKMLLLMLQTLLELRLVNRRQPVLLTRDNRCWLRADPVELVRMNYYEASVLMLYLWIIQLITNSEEMTFISPAYYLFIIFHGGGAPFHLNSSTTN